MRLEAENDDAIAIVAFHLSVHMIYYRNQRFKKRRLQDERTIKRRSDAGHNSNVASHFLWEFCALFPIKDNLPPSQCYDPRKLWKGPEMLPKEGTAADDRMRSYRRQRRARFTTEKFPLAYISCLHFLSRSICRSRQRKRVQ